MGIATGKRVDFYGMTMVRVRNGKIVEAWNNFDFLSFYQQIGMLPQLPV
jgi:predicted ester cyclase